MKHLIVILLLSLFPLLSYSQDNKQNSQPIQGQYFDLDVKHTKTQEDCLINSNPTNNKAKYKNVEYPVYLTKNGKLFIVVLNKQGTGYYRKYIPQQTK